MRKFYKVTNQNETHHGYKYKEGVNILNCKFEPNGICPKEGFYFTDLEFIPKYYCFGVWLREVYLDHNSQFARDQDNKYRTDKIIFGPRYSLNDLKTYEMFKLPQMHPNIASGNNCDVVLRWYIKTIKTKNNGHINDHSNDHFNDHANTDNNINNIMIYSSDAMDSASENGHLNILNIWLNSGLELKYTDDAVNMASKNGHISILDWWKTQKTKNNLKFKYTVDALNYASEKGNINVLNWWLTNELILFSDIAINLASENGHINVLNWWYLLNPFKFNETALINASKNGHENVLEWFTKKDLLINPTLHFLYLIGTYSDVSILNWWKRNLSLSGNKKTLIDMFILRRTSIVKYANTYGTHSLIPIKNIMNK